MNNNSPIDSKFPTSIEIDAFCNALIPGEDDSFRIITAREVIRIVVHYALGNELFSFKEFSSLFFLPSDELYSLLSVANPCVDLNILKDEKVAENILKVCRHFLNEHKDLIENENSILSLINL